MSVDPQPPLAGEPLAIIGAAVRYPGACRSVDAFWDLLARGDCAVGAVPADRWPAERGRPWGGFLDDGFPRRFDAGFFGIGDSEAAALDPQQRLLLEVGWRALEDAGMATDPDRGLPVGVFVAISTADYHGLRLSRPDGIDAFTATGLSFAAAAGRLSYVFGFDGPSMAVDTACSSSLVALHQAILAVRAGDCAAALVAGVNALLSPHLSTALGQMGLLAADGRCKAFDGAGDGYVRAEGCGAVVLKPLGAAQAAGDRVLALVRGSAVNQDGRSNGLTAPSRPAQERLIARALARAGLAPAAVDYVETHGTGTPLGDAIELNALAAAYGGDRERPLLIGSVKTNIGHLEAGAGLAGLIKTVESLRRGTLPAHLHLRRPTPQLDWAQAPLQPVTEAAAWPDTGRPRRAAVSSFGFAGTNAHVILEQAPAEPAAARRRPPAVLLPLSARTPAALDRLAAALADRLERDPPPLADMVLTLGAGRTRFRCRRTVIGADPAELAARLRDGCAPEEPPGLRRRLAELGLLWVAGEPVDWVRLTAPYGAVKCVLPGHPLAPDDHWPAADPPASPPPEARPIRPAAQVPASDRATLRRLIDGEARRLLGRTEPLDPDGALVDQGLTSLHALELCRAVGSALGRAVPASVVFNHPTIARLADHFARPTDTAVPARLDDDLSHAALALLIEQELDRP